MPPKTKIEKRVDAIEEKLSTYEGKFDLLEVDNKQTAIAVEEIKGRVGVLETKEAEEEVVEADLKTPMSIPGLGTMSKAKWTGIIMTIITVLGAIIEALGSK